MTGLQSTNTYAIIRNEGAKRAIRDKPLHDNWGQAWENSDELAAEPLDGWKTKEKARRLLEKTHRT